MNGFEPKEFTGYITRNNGIATGNRYEVEISPGQEDLTLLCHTAKIMGKSFNANTQIYGSGSEYNLPINESFEDLSLSFHCTYGKSGDYKTQGMPEYRFFDNWMRKVINPENNVTGWKNEYQKQIFVNLLDSNNNIKFKQHFVNAIPLSISDLELSSAGVEVLTFDVTFTYDNWLANDHISTSYL